MKVGDLVKDNQNGMLGIVMAIDASPTSGYTKSKTWVGFKYLKEMSGLTFWQPENNMSVISSV